MKIKIESLSKHYGGVNALENINLNIGEGMFGLLGPNGAGKTTLMRILSTLVPQSGGSAAIYGVKIEDKARVRGLIGYLPQEFSFYSSLSVLESMDYLAVLSGINDGKQRKNLVMELLLKVNLEQQLKKNVKALSGGMKRRLGIAQAMLNDPKLLIVDEPTAGLDPEERIRFRNLLRDFSEGRVVLLSTHIVEDIEFTCEKLAVLDKGKLLFSGEVQELLKAAKGNVWNAVVDRGHFEELRKQHIIISSVSEGSQLRVRMLSGTRPIAQAEYANPGLEDAYMKLIKGV